MTRVPAAMMTPHARTRPRGLALVELMIAMALGLVIIAGIAQLYAGSRQSYALSETLTRLDESGRFAIDFLTFDLRMAGYLSCGGSKATIGNTVNAPGNWLYQTGGVEGYEGGVDTPPDEFTAAADGFKAGTDILIIRRADMDQEGVVTGYDRNATKIELKRDYGFQVGEIPVIANPSCTQVSLFQATRVLKKKAGDQASYDGIKYETATDANMIPGNCTNNLFGSFDCSHTGNASNGIFGSGSVVSRFAVHAYYVTEETLTRPPILVRKRLSSYHGQPMIETDELIRDVEDFQVHYGLDTVKDVAHAVDSYVQANQVTDWTKVVSIRFALLMRSHDARVRAKAAGPSYDLLGTTVTPAADRRLRRSFSGIVAVRNNLP